MFTKETGGSLKLMEHKKLTHENSCHIISSSLNFTQPKPGNTKTASDLNYYKIMKKEMNKPDKEHNSARTQISFQFDHEAHEQLFYTLGNQSTTLLEGRNHHVSLHLPPSLELRHRKYQWEVWK